MVGKLIRNTPIKTIIFALMTFFLAIPQAVYAKKVIIYGIDETGSYAFRAQANSIARDIIKVLEPGDVLYVRRITEKSYNDSCAIFRLEIPAVVAPVSNKFDKKARYRRRQMLRKVELIKARAAKVISEVKPVKAPRTDIWGFLAAAADRIAYDRNHQKDVDVKIVIASDMQDNCHLNPSMDLQEAQVIIAGFESGSDPEKACKIKTAWQKKLKDKKAGSVSFLPPDCKLFLTGSL